jgi:hypothetical protein
MPHVHSGKMRDIYAVVYPDPRTSQSRDPIVL